MERLLDNVQFGYPLLTGAPLTTDRPPTVGDLELGVRVVSALNLETLDPERERKGSR